MRRGDRSLNNIACAVLMLLFLSIGYAQNQSNAQEQPNTQEPSSTQEKIKAIGVGNWFTFTANIPEAGYRKTQFFAPHYNTRVEQWDSRAEFWLPPYRDKFSWGPYITLAGIEGSQ